MTISIKPTASGSTIEQDGGTILSVDGSGNLTVPNDITFSGTVTGVSSYSDSDALSLFNASGSAPVYAARAWVNFNGTGTVAIRASGNVSSITDRGTGTYQVNLTTAMPDGNYVVSALGRRADNNDCSMMIERGGAYSSFAFGIELMGLSSALRDGDIIGVAVFR